MTPLFSQKHKVNVLSFSLLETHFFFIFPLFVIFFFNHSSTYMTQTYITLSEFMNMLKAKVFFFLFYDKQPFCIISLFTGHYFVFAIYNVIAKLKIYEKKRKKYCL